MGQVENNNIYNEKIRRYEERKEQIKLCEKTYCSLFDESFPASLEILSKKDLAHCQERIDALAKDRDFLLNPALADVVFNSTEDLNVRTQIIDRMISKERYVELLKEYKLQSHLSNEELLSFNLPKLTVENPLERSNVLEHKHEIFQSPISFVPDFYDDTRKVRDTVKIDGRYNDLKSNYVYKFITEKLGISDDNIKIEKDTPSIDSERKYPYYKVQFDLETFDGSKTITILVCNERNRETFIFEGIFSSTNNDKFFTKEDFLKLGGKEFVFNTNNPENIVEDLYQSVFGKEIAQKKEEEQQAYLRAIALFQDDYNLHSFSYKEVEEILQFFLLREFFSLDFDNMKECINKYGDAIDFDANVMIPMIRHSDIAFAIKQDWLPLFSGMSSLESNKILSQHIESLNRDDYKRVTKEMQEIYERTLLDSYKSFREYMSSIDSDTDIVMSNHLLIDIVYMNGLDENQENMATLLVKRSEYLKAKQNFVICKAINNAILSDVENFEEVQQLIRKHDLINDISCRDRLSKILFSALFKKKYDLFDKLIDEGIQIVASDEATEAGQRLLSMLNDTRPDLSHSLQERLQRISKSSRRKKSNK